MRHKLVLLPVLLATLVGASPALAWTWPSDGPVLQQFTFGDDPYAAGQHRGIDVGGIPGSPVRAPAGGSVSFAGSVPGGGRTVTIQTADGYAVTLLHLGAIGVSRGVTVAEGAAVGTLGSSGDAEHAVAYVHLGVRVAADPQGYLDPLAFLPARLPATGAIAPASEEVAPPAVETPPEEAEGSGGEMSPPPPPAAAIGPDEGAAPQDGPADVPADVPVEVPTANPDELLAPAPVVEARPEGQGGAVHPGAPAAAASAAVPTAGSPANPGPGAPEPGPVTRTREASPASPATAGNGAGAARPMRRAADPELASSPVVAEAPATDASSGSPLVAALGLAGFALLGTAALLLTITRRRPAPIVALPRRPARRVTRTPDTDDRSDSPAVEAEEAEDRLPSALLSHATRRPKRLDECSPPGRGLRRRSAPCRRERRRGIARGRVMRLRRSDLRAGRGDPDHDRAGAAR